MKFADSLRTDSGSGADDGLHRRIRAGAGAPIVIEDDDTAARFLGLGLAVPAASILPRNFDAAGHPEDFVFEALTSTMLVLGRRAGLTLTLPGPRPYRAIHEKDHELVAPTVQFAQAFLLEGGAALAVEFFKEVSRHIASRWGVKVARDRRAMFEVVVTNGKHARRVTYEGPIEGLRSVVDFATRALDE